MRRWWFLLALAGCIDTGPGPQPKKIDAEYVRKHVLRELPAGVERWNVGLGGRVAYLGNAVSKRRIAPGEAVTITHYWQALRSIGDDFRLFALVRGAPGTADFMNLTATDMQIARPPATWQPGEIIADELTLTLRPDWRSPSATLLVGFIEVGKHGTLDRMVATPGPHVRDRAVVAAELEVDLSRAPAPPGTVYIPRARGPITLDGVATEPGWVGAVQSADFQTGEGSPEPVGKATARMTWDDASLYLFVSVVDGDVVSPYTKHDEPLWKADAVEIFIDADGNRRGYIELQVNPNNATFDSWFPGGRAPKGDEGWDSGMQTVVKLNKNVGWDVEIAIPWAAVKGRDDKMTVRLPPKVGDRWRLNVNRVDAKTGGDTAVSSWNRITRSDYHALDRMLVAVFADRAGQIVPSTTQEAEATAAPQVIVAQPVGIGSAAPAADVISIQLRTTGETVIRGRVYSEPDLDTFLRAAATRNKDTPIQIVAEPGVPAARVTAVVERVKQTGLSKVAFVAAAPR